MATPHKIVGLEWENQNAVRAFPLTDANSETDVTGNFKLPRDLIVDLIFPVHITAGLDPSLFHIAQLGIFNQGIIISIGYDGDIIGTASVPISSHVRNTPYLLFGQNISYDFADSIGKIVIGDIENTLRAGTGVYTFDVNGARLVPTVIRPDISGVTSLSFANGTDSTGPLSGDITLQAGTNFRFVVVGVNTIRLDAIQGEGLNAVCGCNNDITDSPPIRTINGVIPDDNGNFTLLGDACLNFEPITNGLGITDTCSAPCCGSTELVVVETGLDMLNKDIQSFKERLSQLELNIVQLQSAMSAAKV